jgi:hypothetical protein
MAMLCDHHFNILRRQPRMRGLVPSDSLFQKLASDLFQLGVQAGEALRKSFWRLLGRHMRLGLFEPH